MEPCNSVFNVIGYFCFLDSNADQIDAKLPGLTPPISCGINGFDLEAMPKGKYHYHKHRFHFYSISQTIQDKKNPARFLSLVAKMFF